MSDQHVKPQWYEVSIGWQEEKTWFLVDQMPPEIEPWMQLPGTKKREPRRVSVDVKTVAGETQSITVQAPFLHMPTLDDAMAVVLKETHTDLSGEVKYHLTSRKEGLNPSLQAQALRDELERLRSCVPADGATP